MGKIFNKNNTTVIFAFLVTVVFLFNCIESDAVLREDELFEKAIEYYQSYQPDKALELFDLFLKEYPDSSALDSVLFWKAKSLIQLKRAVEAKKIFSSIGELFPESPLKGFVEKEIENIKKIEQSAAVKKEIAKEVVKEEKVRLIDIDSAEYEQKLREVEEENKNLEKQLYELLKRNQLDEKELAKAKNDRDALEKIIEEEKGKYNELSMRIAGFETMEKEYSKLKDEKKLLDLRLKESEEKIKTLLAEKEEDAENHDVLISEKEDALGKLRALEQREAELNLVLERIQKDQKDWENLDEYVKQLKDERIVPENKLKNKDKRLSEAEKSISVIEDRIKEIDKKSVAESHDTEERMEKLSKENEILEEELKKEQQSAAKAAECETEKVSLMNELNAMNESRSELEKNSNTEIKRLEVELEKLKYENEEMQEHIKEIEAKNKEIQELESKLTVDQKDWREVAAYIEYLNKDNIELKGQINESEEKLSKAGDLIQKLSDEKAVYESKIKEDEERLKKLNKSVEDKEELIRANNEALESLKLEHEKLMKSYDENIVMKEKDVELQSLKILRKQYDVPVVRIGKEKYTMLQIIEENIYSSKVISKMNLEPVVWRSGNAYEDFIIEQVLFKKAGDKGIEVEKNIINSNVKKYLLNKREEEYLAKYLAIDGYIKIRISQRVIKENEILDYYEANKDKYLISEGEKFVEALSIKYTSNDELEKGLFAIECREEANSGKSLGDIHKSMYKVTDLKKIRYDRLPNWVKEKVKDLKIGETSNIFSTGDQFMILQIQFKNRRYRNYKDVHSEIRRELLSRKGVSYKDIGSWLKEIRSEAEEIR